MGDTFDENTNSNDPVEGQNQAVEPSSQGDEGAQGQDAEPKTFTQEQVNSFMAKEKRGIADKYGDLDELLELANEARAVRESKKTEDEKRAESDKAKDDLIAKLQKDLEDVQSERLREKVARDAGLDPALAARLKGATEEELLADAESLAALLPASQPQTEPKAPKSPAPRKNLKGGGEPDNGDELAGLDVDSFLNEIKR